MSNLYAMRRANGDWFAVEAQGRLRVPLFHSSHDATMARLRNFGMLLFQPVALEPRLLKQFVSFDGKSSVDFSMVNDPFGSLADGYPLERSEIERTMSDPIKRSRRANDGKDPGVGISPQGEWWN